MMPVRLKIPCLGKLQNYKFPNRIFLQMPPLPKRYIWNDGVLSKRQQDISILIGHLKPDANSFSQHFLTPPQKWAGPASECPSPPQTDVIVIRLSALKPLERAGRRLQTAGRAQGNRPSHTRTVVLPLFVGIVVRYIIWIKRYLGALWSLRQDV